MDIAAASAPALFRPITMRGLALANRIVISPMCQHSAIDGCATDWHLIHLGHLALSAAGLLMLEATGVEPAGRISAKCLGLYSDANEAALGDVLRRIRRHSPIAVGLQLAHSGRKGSLQPSFSGGLPVLLADGGWQTVGPSALAFEGYPAPAELDRAGMVRIVAAFREAARRAARLPIDLLELHGAHGYLISSFLSPLANRRTDAYGGDLASRMRFPLEIFEAVREVWPSDRPLGMRLNGTAWRSDGITSDEAVAFSQALRSRECDFIDVSSGGNAPADIPIGPGYQVPLAEKVRYGSGVPTIAVGRIIEPTYADEIISSGRADMVALARGMLNDPRWPWHAAETLGVPVVGAPPQYSRAVSRIGTPGPLERLNRKQRARYRTTGK